MSTRKVIVLAGVLALLVIGTTGCEECCRDRYDLISVDDCPEQPPWQPPGPPIVARPKPGTGGTLEWTVGGDTIDTSSGSAYDSCYLRGDFIGVGLIHMKFYEEEDSPNYTTPSHVRVDNGTDTIEIRRTAFNQLRWEIHTKETVPDPDFCDAYPTDNYGKFPDELLDLATASLWDVDNGKPGEKLEILVKVPGT